MRIDDKLFGVMAGICIGAATAMISAAAYYKKTIQNNVDKAVDKKVKQDIANNIDIDKLNNEIKAEATDKITKAVADKVAVVDKKVDEKIKDFDGRLKVVEDVEARKWDVAKAGVIGLVTIATTLINATYAKKEA